MSVRTALLRIEIKSTLACEHLLMHPSVPAFKQSSCMHSHWQALIVAEKVLNMNMLPLSESLQVGPKALPTTNIADPLSIPGILGNLYGTLEQAP